MKRPESQLWVNDGFWWANMWEPVRDEFHIFRLNEGTQAWTDTGVKIDTRSSTVADTLWDGEKLYVSSHRLSETPAPGYPAYLYRFSYDPIFDRYSLDSGFPVQINDYKTESLVIAKDSTGTLWATWMQDNRIYVNRTTGDDRSWGQPFPLPVPKTSVSADDLSSIVAFDGNKVGVMWGNQGSDDGYWFSVHADGDPDTSWSSPEAALQGSRTADDHINLKTDSSGRVYAAVKTSYTSSSQPQTMVLVRDPATGAWTRHRVTHVSDCPNRPIVLIDELAGVAHVFETAPAPPAYDCNSEGGAIYTKSAPLGTLSFPSGLGTPAIRDDANPKMHNVTSTKQTVGGATGLVALAVERSTNLYWHYSGSWVPVAPSAAFWTGTTSGSAPLTVGFTDASTGGPTRWSWSFGDGTTSTEQHPTHTYTQPGTYTVSLEVANSVGSDIETKTGYVTVTPPVAGDDGSTLTFAPTDDARVSEGSPDSNYATSSTLRVRNTSGSDYRSYLKFRVSGVTPGMSAKLRLYVKSSSSDGGSVYAVGNDWGETTLTWSTAPPIAGLPLASAGPVRSSSWKEFDLGAAITGDGTYSLGLQSDSSSEARYSSSRGSKPPELVLTP